jgi:hypothetical protein
MSRKLKSSSRKNSINTLKNRNTNSNIQSFSVTIGKRDWANLRAGIEVGVIHRGVVVYMGDRNFPVTEQISVVNAEKLLFSEL